MVAARRLSPANESDALARARHQLDRARSDWPLAALPWAMARRHRRVPRSVAAAPLDRTRRPCAAIHSTMSPCSGSPDRSITLTTVEPAIASKESTRPVGVLPSGRVIVGQNHDFLTRERPTSRSCSGEFAPWAEVVATSPMDLAASVAFSPSLHRPASLRPVPTAVQWPRFRHPSDVPSITVSADWADILPPAAKSHRTITPIGSPWRRRRSTISTGGHVDVPIPLPRRPAMANVFPAGLPLSCLRYSCFHRDYRVP